MTDRGAAPRLGVLLPIATLADAVACAQAARIAEQLGFDAVWAADDLAGPGVDAPECLAAAAAVTERIALGLGLAPATAETRAPAWTVKHMTALDALAPGRLRLATGLAGPAEDPAALLALATGHPVPELDPELTPAIVSPALSTRPPVSVAGEDDAARELAARVADTWLSRDLEPAALAEAAAQVAEIAREHDRPAPATGVVIDATGRDRIDGFVQRLGRYTAIGVESVLLLGTDPTDERALARFAQAASSPDGS